MSEIVKTLKELAIIATLILNATEKLQQKDEKPSEKPQQNETTT